MVKYLTISAIITILLFVTACREISSANDTQSQTVTVTDDSKATTEDTVNNNELVAAESEMVATVQTVAPTVTPTIIPEPTATGTPVPTMTPIPHTPTPTDAPEIIEVNTSSGTKVNVRGGPGTNYPIIGQLAPGDEAAVTGFNSDQTWWQINFTGAESTGTGWVYSDIVEFSGDISDLPQAETPPTPVPTASEPKLPTPESETVETTADNDAAPPESGEPAAETEKPMTPEELANSLRCGKDFCVTYQAMVPIWENGGCIGNHSIYVTVLEGPPPGRPLDGIVIGDTFGNVEVASGSKGPGTAEFTLWMNSMSVKVKRHINGTEYTSEESFPFTSHDELIPAEVLAANGYCDGSVEKCRAAQQQNQVCRGHYSWRVTFHKFD